MQKPIYFQLIFSTAWRSAQGFGTSFGMQPHALHAAMNNSLNKFGTDMKIGAGIEQQFPMNEHEMIALGWSKYGNACDVDLGYAWSASKGGPSENKPITLYTTAGGQISGIGVRIHGGVKAKLVDAGFVRGGKDIDVAFRANPCSDTTPAPGRGFGPTGLGDRLVVAPYAAKHSLPLSNPKAYRGSCFDGMGWHYFEDLTWTNQTYGSRMTWYTENIVPVVPMYDDQGNINAIFFASATRQQWLLPPTSNMWDAVPLPTYLMCKNFCARDCQMKDSWGMSTGHIYFNNPKTGPAKKCSPALKCFLPGTGCCPTGNEIVV